MTVDEGTPAESVSTSADLPAEYTQALADHHANHPVAPTSAVEDSPAPSDSTTAPSAPNADGAAATAADAPGETSRAEPASWVPDDAMRDTASRYGLTDEDLRSFGSAEKFTEWRTITDRAVARLQQRAQAQRPTSPSPQVPPAQQQPPQVPDRLAKLDELIKDEYRDPTERAALQAMRDELVATQRQLDEFNQARVQEHNERMSRQFDAAVDKLGFDKLFGASDKLEPAHLDARGKVFDVLNALYQHGHIAEINEDSVRRAFAVAFPTDFQQAIERSTVQRARAQAQARAGDGTFSKPAPQKFDGPLTENPNLHAAWAEMEAANGR